ncbi:hypothetical protein MSG28_007765 [Choristoneura fumiferana]|uniref:Uncharacterized protein n=1 Tax=Choristoneura fumiferana TaxID=7141 RepID=A0ACC0JYI7_CHOFU|nr:hypothetical protein MSG28_007765 [Choristoneura fumiferana]
MDGSPIVLAIKINTFSPVGRKVVNRGPFTQEQWHNSLKQGTKKMEYKTRQWHEKCFCCVVCKNPIGTKSFIPREQEIYCAGCYEDKFATRCVKCNKIITQGGVTYKNEPWHRECFTCTNCNTSLAGQRFTSRDEKPYCADCFGELFAKRCTSCTKPITGIGGTRFISFEDRHWHNDCFICAQCKTSLVGKGFITDGQDIICPECAKQKLIEKTILPVVASAMAWVDGEQRNPPDLDVDLTFRKVNVSDRY